MISQLINTAWLGFPRPNFITGGFFNGKNVDGLYTRNTQRQTISGLVGSSDLALRYIEETSDVFLGKFSLKISQSELFKIFINIIFKTARGHLAAKADFIFGSQVYFLQLGLYNLQTESIS